MAVHSMGFPSGTSQDEAVAAAAANVRHVIGDDDPVASTEVLEVDDGILVKIRTRSTAAPVERADTTAPAVATADLDPVKLGAVAQAAQQFLTAYQEAMGGGLR